MIIDRLASVSRPSWSRRKVDVIAGASSTATVARRGQAATTTIPIVVSTGCRPGRPRGLCRASPRPGGNVTGLTNFLPRSGAKRLELMQAKLFQGITRVARSRQSRPTQLR